MSGNNFFLVYINFQSKPFDSFTLFCNVIQRKKEEETEENRETSIFCVGTNKKKQNKTFNIFLLFCCIVIKENWKNGIFKNKF